MRAATHRVTPTFAQYLRNARKRRGLKQVEAAKLLGCIASSVSQIEQLRRKRISEELAERIRWFVVESMGVERHGGT